jgi:hypothetical protein
VARSVVSFILPRNGCSVVLRRAIWAGLLVLHVGVAPAAWNAAVSAATGESVASLVRLGALLLSSAFFALKIADVAWLRLPPGRKPLFAAVTVVALLHAGAVQRSMGADLLSPDGQVAAAVLVGGVLERERLASLVRRYVARIFSFEVDDASRPVRGVLFAGWIDEFTIPRFATASCSRMGPRAPPRISF